MEEEIKTLRRENNKIVEKGIKKLRRAIKLKCGGGVGGGGGGKTIEMRRWRRENNRNEEEEAEEGKQ